MTEQTKTEWIRRLRSGETPQARNLLASEDARCCLGVLCDIAKDATGDGFWEDGYFSFRGESSDGNLPISVAIFYSIELDGDIAIPDEEIVKLQENPLFVWNGKGDGLALAALNDRGYTFLEIADIIEKYLPVDPDNEA